MTPPSKTMLSSKWVRGNWRTSLPAEDKSSFMESAKDLVG